MPANLSNEIIIVTGAAEGIGRAIAELFCEQGGSVCLADKNEILGVELQLELSAKGHKTIFIKTDVADVNSVENMVAETVKLLGEPTMLINNAGVIVVNKDPLETSPEIWQRLFSINVEGMWHCCRAVLPYMKRAQSGSIVNLGSVHSFQIVSGHFPYAVTKHAVIGLTKTLAVEYAKYNIRVNALCPGMVETPTAFKVWAELPDPEAARAAVAAIHPLGRNASVREMAYPALFLAGKESSFMTGQCLIVDGGRSAQYCE